VVWEVECSAGPKGVVDLAGSDAKPGGLEFLQLQTTSLSPLQECKQFPHSLHHGLQSSCRDRLYPPVRLDQSPSLAFSRPQSQHGSKPETAGYHFRRRRVRCRRRRDPSFGFETSAATSHTAAATRSAFRTELSQEHRTRRGVGRRHVYHRERSGMRDCAVRSIYGG
jgi:hypothetical protein